MSVNHIHVVKMSVVDIANKQSKPEDTSTLNTFIGKSIGDLVKRQW